MINFFIKKHIYIKNDLKKKIVIFTDIQWLLKCSIIIYYLSNIQILKNTK